MYVIGVPVRFGCVNWFYCFKPMFRDQIVRKKWGSIFSTTEPHFRTQNPRWPPGARYGSPNFFPMGDNFKILFSSIGFLGTGNLLKPFTKLCARYFSWIRRIWRFSAGFKHFPSIYHYFDHRNIIFGTISMFWLKTNQMATFRKLWDYQGCQIARYFSCNLLFSAGFKHIP